MMVIFASTQHIVYTNMYKQLIWRPVTGSQAAGTMLHPSSVLCDVSSLSLSLLYPPPGPLPVCPLAGCGPGSLASLTTHQSASAGSVLLPRHCRERAGAGSRNCVVRDNNNNSWIRERLRRRRGEGTLNLTTITVSDNYVLFPGRHFCESKNNCKKQLAVFLEKVLQFIFLLGENSTQCFRY